MINDITYIPLLRKLTEWEWYKNSNTLHIFIHCLLKAQYTESNYQGHRIPAGSFASGLNSMAYQTGLSVRNVRTALKHLKSTGEISSKVTSKFSIITVIKWDTYRIKNLSSDKQVTSNRQASDKQVTTSKEGKKERRKESNTDFEVFYKSYPKKKGKDSAKKAWNKINAEEIPLIINSLVNACKSEEWLKDNGKYIPYPATWLNGKRWEDEETSISVKHSYEVEKPLSLMDQMHRDEEARTA